MSLLRTLTQRARQFGVRRSVAVYLTIVIGIVIAGELAIGHILGQGSGDAASPLLNALALAALVALFVLFLFQGAVEDRERASAALAQSEERFRSLTGLSADWFWETDTEHRLNWIAGGQSMLKLFGSSLAYGQRPWEIKGVLVMEADLAAHRETIEKRAPFHELQLCRPAGGGECSEFHLISGEPRTDREGRFAGYRGVGRDVTERKNAERALSGAKDRLEMALDAGAHAIWDSDLAAGRLFLSEGWGSMLGEPGGPVSLSLASVLDRIHAQDLPAALSASRRAVKGETPSFMAEIRLRTASGDWKWVASSGKVVARDAAGRALRMTGTGVDIDRRKRAEHAMRDAEARYRTLIDLSPDAILLQSDGRIEYANRSAADMLGVAGPAALAGRETLSMVHPGDRPMILERIRYLRDGPGKIDFLERRMLRADGSVVTVEGASVSYLERGRLVVQTVLRDMPTCSAAGRRSSCRSGRRAHWTCASAGTAIVASRSAIWCTARSPSPGASSGRASPVSRCSMPRAGSRVSAEPARTSPPSGKRKSASSSSQRAMP
jgi:PAS domain S-box-containing protein